MATKTLLTIDQYNALDEPAGVRYELDRGELVVSPSPAPRHNVVCGQLYRRLCASVEEHNLGQVIYAVDVKLAEDTVRRPDVMFIRRERTKDIDLDQVPLPVAPDMVMEVVSKHDQPDDLMLKVRQYQRAGVEAIWVLYPKTREAYCYVPKALQPIVLDAERGDKLEEPKLLPGFSLPLSEILP
jgi:Uma2 family endonuclease